MPATPAPFRNHRGLLLAIGWLGLLVALPVWLTRTSEFQLRDQLRRCQYWVLEAQFLLLVSVSCAGVPRLLRTLALRRRDYLFPAFMAAVALALVIWVAPRTNRIYYDEFIYQDVAQNLSDLRLAQMCNDGTVEYGTLQCWRGEYNKEPDGYPYLLNLVYRLGGVHESAGFALNATAAALMVLVIFVLTTALTGSAPAGNAAAVVAALMPEQLRWSHTAAAEPSAALACAFAVMAACGFVRTRDTVGLVWTVAATVFAAQFRPECLLVAPLVVVIWLAYAPGVFTEARTWWVGLLGGALAAPHLGHLLAVRHEGWGASGPRFSTAFLGANLSSNGGMFLGDHRFPVLYSALAVAALLLQRPRRASIVLLAYFAAFWGIFLFFYAGSYNYGADDRFSLMAYPPVAVLAGLGVWRLAELAARWRLPAWSLRLAMVVLAIQFPGICRLSGRLERKPGRPAPTWRLRSARFRACRRTQSCSRTIRTCSCCGGRAPRRHRSRPARPATWPTCWHDAMPAASCSIGTSGATSPIRSSSRSARASWTAILTRWLPSIASVTTAMRSTAWM